MTIRVVIADDQALLAGTFRMLIDSAEDMTVVGTAETGQQAVDTVRATTPDVVLMDIRMPGLDGLAAARQICRDPQLSATRVLILTTFELDEYVARALRAGASGFLGKDVGPEELLRAIRTIAAGETLLSPNATRALVARFLASPERPQHHRTCPRRPHRTRTRSRHPRRRRLSNEESPNRCTSAPSPSAPTSNAP